MITSASLSPASPPMVAFSPGTCGLSASITATLTSRCSPSVGLSFSSPIRPRFAPNVHGNGLMVLACWWLVWMNLELTSTTIALVETTLNIKLLLLDLAPKLQRHIWNADLKTSWTLHVMI
uniref:Proteasome subunit alpha type n=1 Tax=Rhizophora mucronata TaxID=61149 RepID=A0A2P2LXC0_RHIMU